ncbi:hypothetical protein V2J09_007491 [Rumex salicifolius]
MFPPLISNLLSNTSFLPLSASIASTSMADRENSARVTRATKRKAMDAMTSSNEQHLQTPKTKRKRVVLGEIPSNILASLNADFQDEPRKKANQCIPAKTPVEDAVDLPRANLVGIDTMKSDEDPQMCAPYATGIYHYLREMEREQKRRPMPNYLEKVQKDISANMRGILVDWLVEVAEEYKLESDTLYLGVSYIDRYLSTNILNRRKLQLLGVSSLLIASKYEEINPPQVHDFCYITDNTYKKEEVVSMESDVLKSLKFEMGNPTVKTFLRKFTKVAEEKFERTNLQFECLGYYLAELSLLDYACIKFLPSLVAASVVFLAKFTIDPKKHPWDLGLQEYSGYRPSDLEKCVLLLHDLQLGRRGGNLVAIRDKYKQYKFNCASTLSSPAIIPSSYFKEIVMMWVSIVIFS